MFKKSNEFRIEVSENLRKRAKDLEQQYGYLPDDFITVSNLLVNMSNMVASTFEKMDVYDYDLEGTIDVLNEYITTLEDDIQEVINFESKGRKAIINILSEGIAETSFKTSNDDFVEFTQIEGSTYNVRLNDATIGQIFPRDDFRNRFFIFKDNDLKSYLDIVYVDEIIGK